MEVEEVQLTHSHSPSHIFSLRSLNGSKPEISADFSPLQCKKTKKVVRIMPTYNMDLDIAFATELDTPKFKRTQSHKTLTNKENNPHPIQIMIPKPSQNYCQVCRQRYDDYIQHINHPIHKKKEEQAGSHFSIDSLKEVLDSPLRYKPPAVFNSKTSLNSMVSCSSKSNTSLDCSKVLSQTKGMQQTDKMSIASSEKVQSLEQIQDFKPVIKRRQKRKFSNFRALRVQSRQDNEIDSREQNQMDVEE